MRYGLDDEVVDEEYQKQHREYYEYYFQQQQLLRMQQQKQQKKVNKDSKKQQKRANNVDFLNCFFKIDFKETNIEKKIKSKQREDLHLSKMFIFDILIYMFVSFPYTLLRLVLDLFAKDKIKFGLDFFIMYKLALLTFHIHLIVKFFLMLGFNVKFRANFARAFAFEPSYCCVHNEHMNSSKPQSFHVSNQMYQSYRSTSSGSSGGEYQSNSLVFRCCCFFCTRCFLSRLFGPYFGAQQSSKEFIVHAGASYLNEEIDRSTEFDTTHHQFQCPADPDQYWDMSSTFFFILYLFFFHSSFVNIY